MSVDIDAILAEARERVRRKRADGVYGPEIDAALERPLPGGGPMLADEQGDPFTALATVLAEGIDYDPRSRKPLFGKGITFARRSVIGLVKWWIGVIVERQDRINHLVGAALVRLNDASSPAYEARLAKLERAWADRRRDEVAANLHSIYFQARFSGDEPVIRSQSAQFADLYRGRTRVCDLGSGRGTFLSLMRDQGVGAYGVDLDPRMVEHAAAAGFEVVEGDALAHLRSLPDGALDGLFARHIAEHILPGELVSVLRECRRVLRPGSPVVMITPNPATLTVGAHTFWLDPSHLRPIPPELFRFYLEVEGFTGVDIKTLEPTAERLDESVPEGPIRSNVQLLNRTLFGDRDYGVIGYTPAS
ncbi:MAG: hypothetical protein NVS9B6_17700 [Candidatus Limnocylindrales bacterium]